MDIEALQPALEAPISHKTKGEFYFLPERPVNFLERFIPAAGCPAAHGERSGVPGPLPEKRSEQLDQAVDLLLRVVVQQADPENPIHGIDIKGLAEPE